MGKPTFTPGPWRSKPTVGSEFRLCTILGPGNSGAVARSVEQDNASLIAAAPDMYTAIREMLNMWDEYSGDPCIELAVSDAIDAMRKSLPEGVEE